MGFKYLNLSVFSQKFRPKTKVCYKVSLSKNFQQQSCSAVKYLSNGVNILAGDDPIPVKFAPKAPTPIRRMRVSPFTRGALCSQRYQTFCIKTV